MGLSRKHIFREEALRHASHGRGEGDLLRLAPEWASRAYWVLMAAFVASAAYAILGTLHEYASGSAVVWFSGRIQITATVGGTVNSIDVKPGQAIEAGQVLARFASSVETAELGRVEREFELQLVKSLRDPADPIARAALTTLRTQRDVAAARLEQLSIRAPQAGTVGDVRIKPGQRLEAGEAVLTLQARGQGCTVMAMLPAHYRPQLRPGLPMRFEVSGYRYAYQEMRVTAVSAQIVGPDEIKRYLGQDIRDTLAMQGPMVLVEATPAAPTFRVDGQSFEFYHGMQGTAEVRVRTESILVSLVPGLRVFSNDLDR